MYKSALDVFDEMLRAKGNDKSVLYYDEALAHDSFMTLDFSDIEQYFRCGGKECIPEECKSYFGNDDHKNRVKHVFSVYLLGIFCYDKVDTIKNGFNGFIKKIWEKTGYPYDSANAKDDLRRDFLYLWYLTALFHDMGYPYEREEEIVDNDVYGEIVSITTGRTMKGKDCFNCQGNILGIPETVMNTAEDYFYYRLNNCCFNEGTCIDHGVTGGYILYKKLKKLHCGKHNSVSPVDAKRKNLLFSKTIFDNYNIPSAWAIVCHNIWLAEIGSGRDDKYKHFGLGELIFKPGCSPINFKDHPLLFLLDFVDTLDPVKRFGESALNCIYLSASNGNIDTLTMKIGCDKNCKTSCVMSHVCMEKICRDLSFLKSETSETFDFKIGGDGSITFSFCSVKKLEQ